MADERVVAELVAQGAQKFISDFGNAAKAVTELQTQLQSTDRIRTTQLQGNLEQVRETIQQLARDGVQGVNELSASFEKLAQRLESVQRIRTTQLSDDINKINRSLAGGLQQTLAGEAGAARNRSQIAGTTVGTLDPTIRLQQQQLQAVAQAQRVAQAAADAHARTLQGRLQSAMREVANTSRSIVGVFKQQGDATKQVTTDTEKLGEAHGELVNQSSRSEKQGITYLSTLSAIHAASFLATNQTFTLIGSFFTLGAAFSRLGPLGVAVGLAFGGVLGIFNALSTTAQLLQQVLLGIAQAALQATAVVATAVGIAGAAGVKLAADVEQGLALIQAVEGASRAQLGAIAGEAQRIALTFGVAVKDIVDASSLFVRAGGSIEAAINGATEAIIKLQVASAGELKAAEAARAIATGLQAFSKEGVTAIQIADQVAAVAQRSALSFTEVAQAFQQAVPGSVTLGIRLADLSAIIVTLGNSALRGTVAGTSFKQFLLDLVNPSEKAQARMAQLGINIRAADGSIRPIIPIIGDLTTALDRLTEGDRAQAIAEIFESRAGLAGAILSRQTVTQLQELRAELEALTVTDVANTLLLPLNAQLQRLQVTIQEIGRTFGGTLLQPIRSVIVGLIDTFQKLIPVAELAGQAISVVLTGQGFGQLQQRISEITGDTRLAIFFQELVNVFRNVRAAITDDIVPALGEFVSTIGTVLSESGRLTDMVTTFRNINIAVRAVGAVIATAIRSFTLLAVEIIHNEGRGKELRDTLQTIVNVIVSRVLTSLVAMATFLTITTVALIKFGDIAVQVAAKVGDVFEKLADVHEAVARGFIDLTLRARQAQAGINLGTAIASGDIELIQQARKELETVEKLLNAPRIVRNPFAQTFRDLQNATQESRKFAEELLNSLSAQGVEEQTNRVIKSFQELSGTLPTFLDNLLDEVERTMAQVREDIDQGPGAIAVIDEKEVERAKERILEAGRDIARRLDNIASDTTSRIQNIIDKALERIGDINQKLQRDLDKLVRETADKIQDLNDQVAQRRSEREVVENFRRQQDRQLQVIERGIEREDRAIERQLEHTRLLRQRQTEDVQREYDDQASAAERSFQRQQQIAETVFQAVQRAREKALDAAQSAEEKALQRQLDRESTTRQEQQQRAEAKTPEDRKRVEEQIARARSDRNFEQRQQNQLDALRTRHEQQRESLRTSTEQAAQAFRIQQEEAALQFRNKQELKAIQFRRNAEDAERQVRLQEEDNALTRRLINEQKLDGFKRFLAKGFQGFQDNLENQETQRRAQQITRDAEQRRGDLRDEATRQRGEVLEQVEQQLTELNQRIDQEIRNAIQRLEDIEDSLAPDVLPAVRALLLGVQQAALSQAEGIVKGLGVQQDQARAVIGAQAIVTQPTQVPSLVATTLSVQNLLLPQGFVNGITQGVFSALLAADQAGVFDDTTNNSIPVLRDILNTLQSPGPLPTRR